MRNERKTSKRQGDLLFIPMSKTDWRLKRTHHKTPDHGYRKDGIIQEGEATGHHHRLEDLTTADVFRPQFGAPFIVVGSKGATIVHEEHGPIRLEPDTAYQVNIAREFDPTGKIRQVID